MRVVYFVGSLFPMKNSGYVTATSGTCFTVFVLTLC